MTFYQVQLQGIRPLIMHNGAASLDKLSVASLEKAEISRKRVSTRIEADDERLREFEWQMSIWLDAAGAPTIPDGGHSRRHRNGSPQAEAGPAGARWLHDRSRPGV